MEIARPKITIDIDLSYQILEMHGNYTIEIIQGLVGDFIDVNSCNSPKDGTFTTITLKGPIQR